MTIIVEKYVYEYKIGNKIMRTNLTKDLELKLRTSRIPKGHIVRKGINK